MQEITTAFAKPVLGALPQLPGAVITFLVGFILIQICIFGLGYLLKATRCQKALASIIISLANVIMWFILIGAIFQSLGLTQVALTLTGSVALIGLAVAAGANTLVNDVISGIFLARDRDFNIGYKIKFNEYEGIIDKIDVRKIRLRDKNDRLVVIPNGNFDKAAWTVLDRDPEDKKS